MAEHTTTELLELIARVRAGDRAAAAQFATEYFPELRARIRYRIPRSLRREFDSEDAVASAARRLDEAVVTGRVKTMTHASLQSFLAGAAMHCITDRLRAVKTRSQRERDHVHDLARRAMSATTSTDSINLLSEGPLSAEDRELLRLIGAGLSKKAIAGALGITEAGVRMRLVRARRQCNQVKSHEPASRS